MKTERLELKTAFQLAALSSPDGRGSEGLPASPALQPLLAQQPRILYADDEPSLRRCITRFLTGAGYEVTTVENGQRAWELLQSSAWDLLITDQQMGGLTGAELISRVRRLGIKMPIIMVTADVEFLTQGRRQELGIDAVLQKPFGSGELFEAVSRALCAGHDAPRNPLDALGPCVEAVESQLRLLSTSVQPLHPERPTQLLRQSGSAASRSDSTTPSPHHL